MYTVDIMPDVLYPVRHLDEWMGPKLHLDQKCYIGPGGWGNLHTTILKALTCGRYFMTIMKEQPMAAWKEKEKEIQNRLIKVF